MSAVVPDRTLGRYLPVGWRVHRTDVHADAGTACDHAVPWPSWGGSTPFFNSQYDNPTGCSYGNNLYPVGVVINVETTAGNSVSTQKTLLAAGWRIESVTKGSGSARTIWARCLGK